MGVAGGAEEALVHSSLSEMAKHGSWLPCKYEVPVDLLVNQANQSSRQRELCGAEIPKPLG